MHVSLREQHILSVLDKRGFLSFQELQSDLDASPATLRRDLERLAVAGRLKRVRGGASRIDATLENAITANLAPKSLSGVPFHENAFLRETEKRVIGRAAAGLCSPGEGIMIDGGSTTLQMCPHLEGLNLQVLTNSLHIVSALLPQLGTRILLPGGTVFREQNIILSPEGEESMPRFHAPKLFMGAAAIGPPGLMQADVILVAAERRLIERADRLIVLVDSFKFAELSGNVVCELTDIDVIVTDGGITADQSNMIRDAGIELIVAS